LSPEEDLAASRRKLDGVSGVSARDKPADGDIITMAYDALQWYHHRR
jgi:hypothetical protein